MSTTQNSGAAGNGSGIRYAPGWPGIPARWTSSAKAGIGAAPGTVSRAWFTLGFGILDEVYYPRIDQACTRDLGLIVTDGGRFFSEEKRHTDHRIELPVPGVPFYRLVNTCTQGRYRITKEVLSDPRRDVVLQRVAFETLSGEPKDYRLFALLAPHLGNRGAGNTAWVCDYKGIPMLFAQGHGAALALASSRPWLARSAGFVGTSDGWQDLSRHGHLAEAYDRAENGNVALTGEIPQQWGDFILALGFGLTPEEAALRARASLADGWDRARAAYVEGWQAWQNQLQPLDEGRDDGGLYRTSTFTLATHESRRFPGGMIASLSVPWGDSKGDDDLGGYHLVWPRDLVETAGGLLACGANEAALRVLDYLRATQEEDGHWTQNMWLDGSPYWHGVQMDETALPILLADAARREGLLTGDALAAYWPMVRAAVGFLARNGPVTGQDRWEEDAGYSPFTLAAEIAALLAAAELADLCGEADVAAYVRETADVWNDGIERWTYASGSPLARQIGVEGYYVRIAPADTADASTPLQGYVPVKNRPPGESDEPAALLVSADALALVRFGLRAADDPRIVNTVRVIDALLKVDTPSGPAWHRYNDDGYGEHADGASFDGSGIGRAWPLLAGERAHYELAAGNHAEASRLLQAMEHFAGDGGLIPEQVWDSDDIPERRLFRGRPSGSAMPLVWAHAEYIKLLRSLRDGHVFDLPPQTVARYVDHDTHAACTVWRFNHRCRTIERGKVLRLETLAPAVVHWSTDNWKNPRDTDTRDTGLGIHVADLPVDDLPAGTRVLFTFRWPEAGRWEGTDFAVVVRA
ncbi:MAG: glucan 1,4-alpha-glucosidase [Gemmatimonadota bacterium]|jgi:glucoamylase